MDLLQYVDDKKRGWILHNLLYYYKLWEKLNNVFHLPLQKVSVFVNVSVIVTVFVMSGEDEDGVSMEPWSSFSSNNSSNKSSI